MIVKTILRIMIVLLVASVVSGAFFLAFNNNSTTLISTESRQPASITSTNGQSFQPIARPEGGDHDSGSIVGGLGGLIGTLAKITGITILVLALQKAFGLLGNRKLISAQR